MKFNSVFFISEWSDKISATRSKVTCWSDILSRMIWTAVGLGCIREGSFRIFIANSCKFPPSFLIKTGYLNLIDPWGTRSRQLFFFYLKPLSSQPLLSFFFQGSVCYVTQGAVVYQPRCFHCICQGLIVADNLVKVWLWYSWNSRYLGNKQVALAHGMCLLRQVGISTSLGPPGSPSKEDCGAQESYLSLPTYPITSVSGGETEIPDIGTISGTLWPHLGAVLGPFRM